ncbi:MAG TPA: hypothetical protein DCQ96_01580 [Verrucomicrobiales bacterium]|nr:hypothetical protein [Verrucomicrobiales bacterium]
MDQASWTHGTTTTDDHNFQICGHGSQRPASCPSGALCRGQTGTE